MSQYQRRSFGSGAPKNDTSYAEIKEELLLRRQALINELANIDKRLAGLPEEHRLSETVLNELMPVPAKWIIHKTQQAKQMDDRRSGSERPPRRSEVGANREGRPPRRFDDNRPPRSSSERRFKRDDARPPRRFSDRPRPPRSGSRPSSRPRSSAPRGNYK